MNDGTGIYECTDCEGEIELTLECPKCEEELEVKEWGKTECPECEAVFDSWKKAEINPGDDVEEDEDETTASCEKCGYIFEEYKEAGQIIKDQIPAKALQNFGPVALNTLMFGPLGGLVMANWEAVMDIPHAWKAYTGDELDAINAARFPCPECGNTSWEES